MYDFETHNTSANTFKQCSLMHKSYLNNEEY
jgi:hypothetical protein